MGRDNREVSPLVAEVVLEQTGRGHPGPFPFRAGSGQWRRTAFAEQKRRINLGCLSRLMLSATVSLQWCPGETVIGLLEARRAAYEREVCVFAEELLMPFAEVSGWWFALLREHPAEAKFSTRDRVRPLAAEFGGTQSAMRVRLEHTKLVR